MFDLDYWRILPGGLEPEALLRWWTDQGPGVWLETVRLQTDLLRQARSRGEIPPAKQVEFTLASLLHAIQKLKNTEEQLRRKQKWIESWPTGSRSAYRQHQKAGPERSGLPKRSGPLSWIIMS